METQDAKIGTVVQVIGPLIEVKFETGALPEIYTALRITSEGFDSAEPLCIVVEVEQHIGEDRVRCVSMHPTEGLSRGMKAESLGGQIEVPVGEGTLGRVMNVIGEPVDKMGPIVTEKKYPIHRLPPPLEDQSTKRPPLGARCRPAPASRGVANPLDPLPQPGSDRTAARAASRTRQLPPHARCLADTRSSRCSSPRRTRDQMTSSVT